MSQGAYSIVWTKRARQQMLSIHAKTANDSLKEANRMLDAIESIIDRLPQSPTKYPADKIRKIKDGTYRAFIKSSYRIFYRILNDEIRIVQVRHMSRKTRYY